MEKYDVIIIGAGPAGLFSAYELITNKPNLKIVIMEKGKLAKERNCPMQEKGGNCKNCQPCSILSGYGGAGTFSDGKLNFIPKLGKTNLYKYMDEQDAKDIIDDTEKIFNKFNMDGEVFPSNMDEAKKIEKQIDKKNADLLIIKQKHLGSDKLPKHIQNFTDYLLSCGVEIFHSSEVIDVHSNAEDDFTITYFKNNDTHDINCSNVIIAPGRSGAKWVEGLVEKYDIPYFSDSIEIGVRVETKSNVLEKITSVIYDPTIFIKTKTYNDEIRTFCTNPKGFVAKENYNGYVCVNGHALKDIKSNNSNFAFISKVKLENNNSNTRIYGENIAKVANALGGGKPILQRLGSLKNNKVVILSKDSVQPTLSEYLESDLGLILPHRIIVNILEGLEILEKIIPGVNADDTILYGPEIKFFSNEIITDNNMKIKGCNMYFIGDGSGKTGNIVSAAATGLIAARNILKE